MSGNLKERILNKALELFNTYGYESVKMRDISSSLNISPGNLTYHFKKKMTLSMQLYSSNVKIIKAGNFH